MKKSILLGATALLAVSAQAQTINYTALQDAFGQPVTTSVTGKPQVAADAPAALHIITAEDIKATGLDNLPDILARVGGIDLLRWGAGSVDIGMRGYNQPNSPRLLVLLNGRQVYSDHYALVNWSTIPVQLSEIKQIEVVKGPVGAIYGFNAVAGVVNIITQNPLYDTDGTATARFGNNGAREVGLSKNVKVSDSFGLRFSAGYKEQDEFSQGSITAVERGRLLDPESSHVAVGALAQVTDSIQAGLELTRSKMKQTDITATNSLYGDDYLTKSAKLDLIGDAGNAGLVSFTAYRNWLDFEYFGIGKSDVTTSVVQLSDLIQIGTDHTVKISGEYRHNSMGRFPAPGATISYDVWAVAGMWDWRLTDKLSFTNAVRSDWLDLSYSGAASPPYVAADFDRSISKISVNSGLVYKATDVDTLRATYGLANQLPSILELGGFYLPTVTAAGLFASAGNPHIKPSKVQSYELGYDRALAAINGGLHLSVFRQTTDDIKSFLGSDRSVVNGRPASIVINAGDSASWGFEAAFDGRTMNGVRYGASYSWNDINDDLTVNKGAIATRPVKFEGAAPRHKLQGNVGWSDGALSTDLNLSWQSKRTLLHPVTGGQGLFPIDSTWTGTASVGYLFETGTEVRFTASDFLRTETALGSALETERRVFASVSQKF